MTKCRGCSVVVAYFGPFLLGWKCKWHRTDLEWHCTWDNNKVSTFLVCIYSSDCIGQIYLNQYIL